MEKGKTETRQIQVNYTKEQLYSSLNCHLKRRQLSPRLMGYDLILGSVFGSIRHPEKTIEQVIAESVEACKLPGKKENLKDGIYYIMEALETVNDYEEHQEDLEIIKAFIDKISEDVRKEYCYGLAVKLLPVKKKPSIGDDIIKNMLYKKLVADDSTWESLLEYAAQRIGIFDMAPGCEELIETAQSEVPKGELEEYIMRLADEAYKM